MLYIVGHVTASLVLRVVSDSLSTNNKHIKTIKSASSGPGLKPCTGAFTASMGLPCAHQVEAQKALNQGLQINDFHEH